MGFIVFLSPTAPTGPFWGCLPSGPRSAWGRSCKTRPRSRALRPSRARDWPGRWRGCPGTPTHQRTPTPSRAFSFSGSPRPAPAGPGARETRLWASAWRREGTWKEEPRAGGRAALHIHQGAAAARVGVAGGGVREAPRESRLPALCAPRGWGCNTRGEGRRRGAGWAPPKPRAFVTARAGLGLPPSGCCLGKRLVACVAGAPARNCAAAAPDDDAGLPCLLWPRSSVHLARPLLLRLFKKPPHPPQVHEKRICKKLSF